MNARSFNERDQDMVLRILEEGLKVQENYAVLIYPPEDEEFFQDEWQEHISGLRTHPEEWRVCEIDERVVGLLWLRFLPSKIGLYGTVREIMVASGYRNLGIGTRLLDHAEVLAKKRNADFFLISGLISNPAIRLYKRKGFIKFPDRYKKEKNPNHVVLWKPYSEELRSA